MPLKARDYEPMCDVHFRVVCIGVIKSGAIPGGKLSVSKVSKNGDSIQLEFDPSNAPCKSELRDKSIKDGLFGELKAFGSAYENREELGQILDPLQEAVSSLIRLIKYHLGYYSFKDNSPCHPEWSEDGLTWCSLNIVPFIDIDRPFNPPALDQLSDLIQESLDSVVEPFLGLDLLHRAKLEDNTVIKWILAKTATEITIKKALVHHNPQLERELLIMHSPSLRSLLSIHLEKHLGRKSSYHAQLEKRSDIRDALIHRPPSTPPSRSDTFAYISTVEKAIFELLGQIFPEDRLIKHYSNNVLPYR